MKHCYSKSQMFWAICNRGEEVCNKYSKVAEVVHCSLRQNKLQCTRNETTPTYV